MNIGSICNSRTDCIVPMLTPGLGVIINSYSGKLKLSEARYSPVGLNLDPSMIFEK